MSLNTVTEIATLNSLYIKKMLLPKIVFIEFQKSSKAGLKKINSEQ